MKENSVSAELVFTNGKIYTVNDAQPWVEAIAINGNEIVFVGSSEEVKQFIGPDTMTEDLGGKFMMRGIISSHDHSIFYMMAAAGLVITELSQDKNKMLAEVKKYLEANPDGPYYSYGGGYESEVVIHRSELDAITGPGVPFFMFAQTGHGGWANTRALEQAWVTKGSEDPIDFFERDEDGTPTGYLGTAAACGYMFGIAGIDKDAMKKAVPSIMDEIVSNGVTHLFEAGQPPGSEETAFAAVGELEKEGKLKVRMTVSVFVQRPQQAKPGLEALKKYRQIYNSDFFKVNTLKIHGDGSLEGHTAYLLEDYADKPGERGILSLPEDKSIEAALEAAKNGFHLHTHAIGEGANRSFLNVMEAVRKAGYDEPRLTMGHTVIVTNEDLPRFKELNVTANFYVWEAAQPFPLYRQRLGAERYPHMAMRIGTLLDMGARVAFSADWPSTHLNPFLHMHAGITRGHNGEEEILGSEKDKVTVAQAIRAYTLDAAYVVAAESYSGSLEVGKKADLIILDRNLFEIPEDDIAETQVLKTILDGRVVFDRNKN